MTVSFTLTAMPLMVTGPDCALRAEPAGQSNTAKAMNGVDLMKRWAHSRKGLPPGQGPASNWAKSPSEYSKPTLRWTAIISQCFVPGGRILEPPPKARGNGARLCAEHQPQRHGEARRFGIIRLLWASALAAAGPSDTAAVRWWFQDAPVRGCTVANCLPGMPVSDVSDSVA